MINDDRQKKLEEYLMNKYSEEARNKAVEDSQRGSTVSAIASALAGFGAGMAGRDPSATTARLRESDQKIRQNKITQFDQGREQVLKDYLFAKNQEQQGLDNEFRQKQLEQRTLDREEARADRMAMFKERQADRNEAREDRQFWKNQAKQEKYNQDIKERTTSYGIARTKDDAKKLKEASELKDKFDRQLDELIKLREDYGVEYFDREAVGRGKQLSKDLLLTYKDLSKLGVLSQSDERILNAIIPSDPLGQDWMPGQDSIMNNLKKFKGDIAADFQTRLKTRLENYEPQDKKPSGMVKVQAPNGKIINVPEDKLEEVIAKGGKVLGSENVADRSPDSQGKM